jgi:hypothetical protein
MIKFLLVSYILVTAVTSCNQKQQSQNNQTSEHHSIEVSCPEIASCKIDT